MVPDVDLTTRRSARFDAITEADLREVGSMKWSRYPDAVGAFVAEMDFGLAPAVTEALARLETAGRKPRIPVEVVRVRGRLRVDLLIGRTR